MCRFPRTMDVYNHNLADTITSHEILILQGALDMIRIMSAYVEPNVRWSLQNFNPSIKTHTMVDPFNPRSFVSFHSASSNKQKWNTSVIDLYYPIYVYSMNVLVIGINFFRVGFETSSSHGIIENRKIRRNAACCRKERDVLLVEFNCIRERRITENSIP